MILGRRKKRRLLEDGQDHRRGKKEIGETEETEEKMKDGAENG